MGPLVCVVDDDDSVRESLVGLLVSAGYAALAFASAECFLAADARPRTACLILDVRMPRMTGPELQAELASAGDTLPIVFVAGHPADDVRARVMNAGAVAFLVKPFDDDALLAAIDVALARPR